MHPIQIAKISAWAHAALGMATVYYVAQIWNYTPLERMPSADSIAFAGTALPPLLALWIGTRLSHRNKAHWLLASGLGASFAAYAAAFLTMIKAGADPMAPLLLIVVSLWITIGLLGLIIAVWLTGRTIQNKVPS